MFRWAAGLPVLPRRDLAAHRRRTISRCQRRTVSGVTSRCSPWQRAFGITASRVARSARSAQSSLGRRGYRRCRTASRRRRIKISAVFQVSSRRDSRSQEAARVVRRKTNRRHMTGDHQGRTSEKATLQVRAADEILGTHRPVSRPDRQPATGLPREYPDRTFTGRRRRASDQVMIAGQPPP